MSAGLLERDCELASIDQLLDDARCGHGSLTAIAGPPGIGKTSLMAAAAERAGTAGLRVLRARASRLERDFAFGVARQLFEPLVSRRGSGAAAELLGGAAGLAAPVLGRRLDEPPPAPGEPAHAALLGLFWLLDNLAAEQPLLVTIDDLQWSDGDSAEWVGFAARRLSSTPAAILVALRGEDDPGLAHALLDPATRILRPRPLGREAASRLLEGELGRPADAWFAKACVDATGGNPFLLSELARAVAAQGIAPERASAACVAAVSSSRMELFVATLIGGLADGAAALARSLALLGPGAELREAAALAGLPLAAAAAASDALRHAGVLAGGGRLSFASPLLAHVVGAAIPPGERALAHARAARVLDERGPANAVTAHLLRSEPSGVRWAVARLMKAAGAATACGAPRDAVALLRRAEREHVPVSRAAVLAALGRAERRIGDRAAAGHLQAALALTDDVPERGAIALELGRALIAAGEPGRALETLDAHAALVREPAPELALRLEAELCAGGRTAHGWVERTVARIERIPRDLEGDTAGRRALLACLAGELAAQGRDADSAVALAERALADGALHGDTAGDAPVYLLACSAMIWADRHEAAQRHLGAVAGNGSPLALAHAAAWRAESLVRQGEPRRAEAAALEALRACAGHPDTAARPLALAWLVLARVAQGRDDAAAAVLEASPWSARSPQRAHFAPLLYARGELRRARRDLAGALAEFDGAGRLLASFAIDGGTVVPWRSASAAVLAALGRDAAAWARADRDLAEARAGGSPAALGRALRSAALAGRPAGRIGALSEAVEALAGSETRLEHAHALCDLGAALRRTGARRDSRAPLRAALDLATDRGAAPLVARARAELGASGARPRRGRISGPDALTPAELRVAGLATDGLSNREIAQTLFVTVKTVETQLGQSYLKLGISSRRELAAALSSGSLPEAVPQRLRMAG